ncbi:DinB family protein [Pedobacter endophyticus]|uniref:DinB family protein n=1 Tax=Pedobacter endophyticus TaxID=2789740 RepID=A0A7S9L2W9_9SPHI|nr:DinB family protein [Pedobacter endophyticus]QPH41491.1 DinB family protein [Pedobacter endophyticus]
MTEPNKPSGAIAALLDEYKKAIDEFILVIEPLSTHQSFQIIEPRSSNPDCISIQTILTHVTASIFSYAVYIENSIGLVTERPERNTYEHAADYINRLKVGFDYTQQIFINHPNIQLEALDPSKKINAKWGQQYDVEQMLEHAIVHILRHRRQIERALRQF